jgi:23S rRNA G2445 N2-methylase RlmL
VKSDVDEVRRSSVFLLGRSGGTASCVIGPLNGALRDNDPKVRKNAAIALGRLGSASSVGDLIRALDDESEVWVRPSIVLALGPLGGEASVERLQRHEAEEDEEQEALAKALDRAASSQDVLPLAETLDQPMPFVLACPVGLEEATVNGLTDAGQAGTLVGRGDVAVSTATPLSLFSLRTFDALMVPLGACDESDISATLIGAFDTLRGLYVGTDRPIRYRLELRGIPHRRRQTLIRSLARDIDGQVSNVRNSPSAYDLEFQVRFGADGTVARARIGITLDPRFDYRVADVPASMRPAIAASVWRVLADFGVRGRGIDPFCGSGTFLIEGLKSGQLDEAMGSDLSGRAIDAAGANADAAGLRVCLHRSDVARLEVEERFDVLVANLPFGIRAGTHDGNRESYHALIASLSRLVRRGGWVALYTQEIELTRKLIRSTRAVELKDERRIEAGGLMPGLFIGQVR